MASLGTVVVVDVKAQDSGHFKCTCRYAGHDGTNSVEGGFDLDNVAPTITSAALEAAIKNETKTWLMLDHGFTFGLLDTVRMIGATI